MCYYLLIPVPACYTLHYHSMKYEEAAPPTCFFNYPSTSSSMFLFCRSQNPLHTKQGRPFRHLLPFLTGGGLLFHNQYHTQVLVCPRPDFLRFTQLYTPVHTTCLLLFNSAATWHSSTHAVRALQTRQAKQKHQLSPVYVKSAGCLFSTSGTKFFRSKSHVRGVNG